MANYKFIYFDLRGRGEAIRYLFADNAIKYEDILVKNIDSFRAEWKSKMIFGQLPCLKDGDFEMVQFNAILRHLGRKHNMYGNSNEEKARIDMISDGIEDLRKKYTDMIYGNYVNGKAPYIETLSKELQPFENMLAGNDASKKGFSVGNQASFVDYNLYDILDIHLVLSPSCLDSFPTLAAFHRAVNDRPGISAHRQTDAFKTKTINYGPNQ